MKDLISLIFAQYVITLVITNSHAAKYLREKILSWFDSILEYPFSTCRLCIGFWVSLILSVINRDSLTFNDFLLIYGGGYFLATQERTTKRILIHKNDEN